MGSTAYLFFWRLLPQMEEAALRSNGQRGQPQLPAAALDQAPPRLTPGETGASPGAAAAAPAAAARPGALLVVLASDPEHWEQSLVVINSAVLHAAEPSRLCFRVVTLAADAAALLSKLRARLPPATDLQTVAFDAWLPRVSRLLGGGSSSRKELFGALNFAAFYVHELFPKAARVLYLDTDVVVLADLAAELAGLDLGGQPAAAARDCSQRLAKYVDLGRLKRKAVQADLPLQLLAKKDTCVANRGVVLVDVRRWADANVTDAIEALVRAHLSKRGPLWRSGVSQPPFLLAVAGRYHDLGAEFNVRGLGRGDIAPEEVAHYRKHGLWSTYYDGFLRKCEVNCCPGCKGWALTPHIAPHAHLAKVLHFNGRLKPHARGRRSLDPVGLPPPGMSRDARGEREQIPLCSCGPRCLQECAGLWWKYLPGG